MAMSKLRNENWPNMAPPLSTGHSEVPELCFLLGGWVSPNWKYLRSVVNSTSSKLLFYMECSWSKNASVFPFYCFRIVHSVFYFNAGHRHSWGNRILGKLKCRNEISMPKLCSLWHQLLFDVVICSYCRGGRRIWSHCCLCGSRWTKSHKETTLAFG